MFIALTEPMIRRNLRNLYHVENAPSDTCLRERLDKLSPRVLRRPFDLFPQPLKIGLLALIIFIMCNLYLTNIHCCTIICTMSTCRKGENYGTY